MSENNDLTKLNKDLEKNQTSLKSKMNSLKDKITQFSKYKNQVILCDVSGSMASFVNNEDEDLTRAIDVVNTVLHNFKGCNLWEFSSPHSIHKVEVLSEPNSGTAMHTAFDVMKSQNYKEFILITDGQPDVPDAALKSAKGLKINIIYIGPQPTPKFLEDLARVTGGNFVDVELIKLGAANSTKELETKIRLMLNA